ncbi:lamin tail domain-containing protein [Candidatus Saccharibacteria bacterium]|nr:lamin tail domain-containing protein [Candidatus Saccharibacteria bacterium]
MPKGVLAATPPVLAVPSGLALAEIKVTGNEFVMLENNTGTTISDLSKYWLYNFNNVNPLAASVSSSSQQLPAGSLASGQTVLLSANGGSTCGAAVTAKLALSLTDSGGFLEVVQTSLSGGLLVQVAGDAVSWSSGLNSAAGMITNVPSNSSAPNGAYYRYQNPVSTGAAYLWQQADVDTVNSCQLNVFISGVSTPGPTNPGNQLLAGDPPPATIISLSDDTSQTQSSTAVGLPPADIGLAAPQINEVLPNPAEPQTDSEDEFIELYNSNDKAFDLTGFIIQTGTTTFHNYSFPAGTMLEPKSFSAFFSVDTNLSLSNTSGQARLLDPFGNTISTTEIYSSAKDGQSWSLANGKWYWTSSATPNAANIIVQPLSIKSLSVGSPSTTPSSVASATKKSATPAAKTNAAAAPKAKATSPTNTSSTLSNNKLTPATTSRNLHPLVLAGVGALAVAYAAYEYRDDLANRFYQFRRYRETRRTARKPS